MDWVPVKKFVKHDKLLGGGGEGRSSWDELTRTEEDQKSYICLMLKKVKLMAQRLEDLKPYLPHPNAKSHELISLVLQTKTKTR